MPPAEAIGAADIAAFYDSYRAKGDKLDVVVFSAPQLSLVELQMLADRLALPRGRAHISWMDIDQCRRVVESFPLTGTRKELGYAD